MEKKITVVIVTKNDGEVIVDAIKSVKNLADEIIVVDGGSNDETVNLAKKNGAKVFVNQFRDFADQRNLAAAFVKSGWIFYLDSDERATPSFISELRSRIEKADDTLSGFKVKRKTFFYGRDWKFEDKVERIFKKEKLLGWHGVVHETAEVDGKLVDINEPILHFTHRNLEQMVKKTNDWSDYEAELRFKSNHPRMSLWRFMRVIMTAFLDSYFRQGGYKNGTAGVIEAIYQSFSMFITYAKLWEKQNLKNK